jgi:hypothetical protein
VNLLAELVEDLLLGGSWGGAEEGEAVEVDVEDAEADELGEVRQEVGVEEVELLVAGQEPGMIKVSL